MTIKYGFLAASVLALAACSWQGTEEAPPEVAAKTQVKLAAPSVEQLLDKTWVVDDVNQEGIIDSSRATLNFDDKGRVAGRSFCNRYMGDYQENNGSIHIEQLAGTMMACPKAIMLAEQAFLKALTKAAAYQITEQGALLLIADEKVLIKAFVEDPAKNNK